MQWTIAPEGGDTDGTGALSMRAVTTDGEEGLFTIPTVRTADGTLRVPLPQPSPDTITPPTGLSTILDVDDGWMVGRPDPRPSPTSGRPDDQLVTTYLEVGQRLDPASSAPIGSGDVTWTPGEPYFLDAIGNTALQGGGEAMELAVWTESRIISTSALPEAVSGALLGTAGDGEQSLPAPSGTPSPSPEPTAGATASPSEPAVDVSPSPPPVEPSPSVPTPVAPPSPEAAPQAVTDTAAAIRQAALAEDWAALRGLIPADGFTASFGNPDDPIAYYQQLQAEGTDVLGILTGLLAGAPGRVPDSDLWAWPREFAEGTDYLGWRAGITDGGTWRYFVAGD